ncbi:SDR family NAD(P)-dependent oxidoreductase [uncultured Pseudokineococcus sp.]|uniref:SDR family NAD(P)-dependent oxidoreductase n=1 Tax=uncultured Pseudokineococcus sp. TaxID=1642928 RepID=UPI002620E085|nr:SDR family NAD(P)-dependent oxidoreductase [uncultured Pseudokineococcus sp.]
MSVLPDGAPGAPHDGAPGAPLDGAPGAGAGRTVLVTGASSGIGWHAARRLAALGARVLLGSRDAARGERAAAALRARVPGADVAVVALDLADLRSVRAAAADVVARGPLDALLANAGVTGTPGRRASAQGHELMLATNHLGHALLTAELLPALVAAGERSGGARVVAAGSIAHRFVHPPADERGWQSADRFASFRAYSRSKLAVLLHAAELDRRLRAAGLPVRSLAFHPGYAVDLLDAEHPQADGGRPARPSPARRAAAHAAGVLLQGKDGGARPAVAAVLAPGALSRGERTGGRAGRTDDGLVHLGPGGPLELAGPPRRVRTTADVHDRAAAARLWALTEQLVDADLEPRAGDRPGPRR